MWPLFNGLALFITFTPLSLIRSVQASGRVNRTVTDNPLSPGLMARSISPSERAEPPSPLPVSTINTLVVARSLIFCRSRISDCG
jgi:hypothetical protein